MLPLEHVLLALAIVRLRVGFAALPLSLTGFALHASFSHRALAEREGGRPMFEPAALALAHVDHGLVFVDTDHGFDLGHDPGQWDATRGIVVARFARDAHDFELWNRLGRPASYRYSYSPAASFGRGELVAFEPPASARFEAESDWPPLAIHGGWAQPDFSPCASNGKGLRLHPTDPTAGMSLDLALTTRAPVRIRLGWIRDPGPATTLTLSSVSQAFGIIPAPVSALLAEGDGGCVQADFGMVISSAAVQRVRLTASRSGVLDYLEVEP